MGNHHSHKNSKEHKGEKVDGVPHPAPDNISTSSSKKGISRTPSGTDIQDRTPSQLIPVENLAKVLKSC